jgi:hypothetical protein
MTNAPAGPSQTVGAWAASSRGKRVKGTKLWQAAGSPIIQGRSRRQRPSWQQWLPAWVVSGALVSAFVMLTPAMSSGSRWSVASGVAGALVGSVVGTEVSRAMGWRFPMFWGVVVGTCAAVLMVVVGASLLPA